MSVIQEFQHRLVVTDDQISENGDVIINIEPDDINGFKKTLMFIINIPQTSYKLTYEFSIPAENFENEEIGKRRMLMKVTCKDRVPQKPKLKENLEKTKLIDLQPKKEDELENEKSSDDDIHKTSSSEYSNDCREVKWFYHSCSDLPQKIEDFFIDDKYSISYDKNIFSLLKVVKGSYAVLQDSDGDLLIFISEIKEEFGEKNMVLNIFVEEEEDRKGIAVIFNSEKLGINKLGYSELNYPIYCSSDETEFTGKTPLRSVSFIVCDVLKAKGLDAIEECNLLVYNKHRFLLREDSESQLEEKFCFCC